MAISKFKFVVRGSRDWNSSRFRSVFALSTDEWDDFSYKVHFRLAYFDEAGHETEVGEVKILSGKTADSDAVQVNERTMLPSGFEGLPETFISLGQSESYYETLFRLFGDRAGKALVALRDIAWHPQLATRFEPTSAFRNALLRFNSAERARRFGRELAQGRPAIESFSFNYEMNIEGADGPIEVRIDFDSKDVLPGRIVGVIGRNAVGKTRFLASLAGDLVQISRKSAISIEARQARFPGGRPIFTRVIAISYSAFDRFQRPPKELSSSYMYCGVRNEKGEVSRNFLEEVFARNLRRIVDRQLRDEWQEYMVEILGKLGEQLIQHSPDDRLNDAAEESSLILSSGQSILAHLITALLAWAENNSIILFDEPETHLHPNAVASLFNVLTKILRKHDSYAVLATHSPLVIQEIPAKRVLHFRRTGNLTTSELLAVESFGASIAELTKHVFETIEVDDPHKRVLSRLANSKQPEEVMALFDRGLSSTARAYLIAQYGLREKEHG